MKQPTSRRSTLRGLAGLATVALLATACGSDDEAATTTAAAETTAASTTETADATGTSVETTETTAAGTDATVDTEGPTTAGSEPAGDGAFPVSIENQFGTTEIESKPERVVSVGYTDGDYILALGVTPVGIRDWYGEQPGGLWPWAAESDAASAGDIEVLSNEDISPEKVAALDPDVIIAIGSGITEEQYETLSQIAPTVAQTDDYAEYGTPWDVAQLTIGKALGLEAEAEAIVDDTKAMIADAAAAHPDWAGKTANFSVIGNDGSWYAYGDQDTRGRLLTELGFAIPAEVLDLAGDLFYAEGSAEEIDVIDADVLLYTGYTDEDQATIEALPLFTAVPAIAEGRGVYIDIATGGAMSFSTTLSIPYALDAIVPLIEGALGDGATSATGAGAIVPGEDADVDAVVEAYSTVFDSATTSDEKAAYLPDAAALQATIDGYATAGEAVGGIVLQPTAVSIDGDNADVTYDVLFAGTPVYEDQEGTAVLVDGVWTISRDEFCGFMASARNPCA